MNLSFFRHAFFLILLSLLGGFLIPHMVLPGLGLSAHTIGLLGAALLMGVGVVWPFFDLQARGKYWLQWSWIGSSYLNWLACIVGGFLGAGMFTPIASAGTRTGTIGEWVTGSLFAATAILSLIAVGLSLWGLKSAGSHPRKPDSDARSRIP